MTQIRILISVFLINITAFTQSNEIDTIQNWTYQSNLKNYIGSKVYLPEFRDAKIKSESWFNEPFLFTKNFHKIDASGNSDLQKILQHQINSTTTDFNYLQTNIYSPSIYFPSISSYSKKLINNRDVSNKQYKILNILSESEVKSLINEWNTYTNEKNSISIELAQKSKKWAKSEKSLVYEIPFGEERIGIMLESVDTKDTVYFIDFFENQKWKATELFIQEFFYVPYIKQQKEFYENKTLIYNGDWNNTNWRKYDLKEKDPAHMDNQHSEWLCEVVSIAWSPYILSNSIAYQLKNEFGNTIILYDLEDFIRPEEFEKQEQNRIHNEMLEQIEADEARKKLELEYKTKKEEEHKFRMEKYVQKYGQRFGSQVASYKLEIGMTKDMCLDTWGSPTNFSQEETQGSKYEIWLYPHAKLYFKNNKLTKIKSEI